jgi:hypothetical protein
MCTLLSLFDSGVFVAVGAMHLCYRPALKLKRTCYRQVMLEAILIICNHALSQAGLTKLGNSGRSTPGVSTRLRMLHRGDGERWNQGQLRLKPGKGVSGVWFFAGVGAAGVEKASVHQAFPFLPAARSSTNFRSDGSAGLLF